MRISISGFRSHRPFRACSRSAGAAGVVIVMTALLLSACSSSPAATSDPPTSTTLPITTTTLHYVPTYVNVGGRKVLMPTEEHHEPLAPLTDIGQNVIITTQGFEPLQLDADKSHPVVFTNLTDKPEEVILIGFGVKSGPIAPGRTWSWSTQDSIQLGYSNANGTEHAQLHMSLLPTQSGSSSSSGN